MTLAPTHPRSIRLAALLLLYQIDLRGDSDSDDIRNGAVGVALAAVADGDEDDEALAGALGALRDEGAASDAFELATCAFRDRRAADEAIRALAPEWPAVRQPAMDRAILRLAHFEMTSGRTPAKAAVNEAVELAKVFGGERSPAFVNGVLDKVLKRVLAGQTDASANG
ncbi:MAG: transcription antitermination factor NusB [Phycisphaerales bacterium]